MDNTDADTNGIAKDAVLTETFKVRVDNGTDRSTKDLSIQITGINDDPVLTAPTDGSLTEGSLTTAVTNTLTVTDADTGEAAGVTFAVTGGAVTSGVNYLTGTYGTLALTSATGAYTYTLNASDADTVALTAADNVSETFTVTATDAQGGVGTGTLSIAIAGSGITVNAIATDDKINAVEDAAGFNITGRGNVGQTVTLAFSSSNVTLAGGNTATVDSSGDWSVAVNKTILIRWVREARASLQPLGQRHRMLRRLRSILFFQIPHLLRLNTTQ
jgi:VCBS repeat-containing protein